MKKIVSLFDGMSCAQQALDRLGLKDYIYYASEVDKHAIKVTQANYPNTIQIGDVCGVKGADYYGADLLVAGSPCQGFSIAGKQLNFNDPRSALFFEFVRIKNEMNPKYFLLENVRMKKEYSDRISDILGIQPIMIDSALVSAQSRKRLYWTNIPGVNQPEDRGILLKDILEQGLADREKSYCIDANYFKGGNPKSYAKGRRQLVRQLNPCKKAGGKQPRMQDRVYDELGKSPCLTQFAGRTNVAQSERRSMNTIPYRKLTVTECERLQTVREGYTSSVSNTQAYKMLGNGMTVEVIRHILSYTDLNK